MNVLIIGNGIAGNSAAFAIREVSKEIAITVLSEETPPLYSACVLPNYLAGDIDRDKVFLMTQQHYSQRNVDIILGQKVTEIDVRGNNVLLDTHIIHFDKLIIATGGEVVIPPIEGLHKRGILKLKSLTDADEIADFPKRRAVIIGSGFIGLETAIALRKRGWEVAIIESLSWILPRVFDEKPSQLLRRIVEDHGIRVFVGEKVKRIRGDVKVEGVVTDRREVECNMVIIATGMRPRTELARQAGLKVGELGGIWVDKQMMTSAENIYACGDCVEAKDAIFGTPTLSLLWHNAKEQGIVAGLNCAGMRRGYPGSQDISGIDIFGTFAVSVGRTMSSLKDDNIEIIERGYQRDYRRLLIADGRLVGVQAIGRNKYVGILLGVIRRGSDIHRTKEAAILSKRFDILQLLGITKQMSLGELS